MSDSMGDLLYERKFNEMQMYIPFLTRVIDKLQNNEQDKPRKAQLEKMKVLHDLLTNNQKKLKIDTLLKCESVLKKLHAKIEKSDEVSPPKAAKKPSATEIPSHVLSSVRSPHSAMSSPLDKHLLKCISSGQVNLCPASPTQFGDIDFRPPVEIPTERRGSPVRPGGYWERQMSNHSPVDSSRNKSSSNSVSSKTRPPPERQRNSSSNHWGSTMNSSGSSSHHNNSWPSSASSSSSSMPSSSRRSVGQQRYDPKQKESSEEENWDDPEDDVPVQLKPPAKHVSRSPPPPPLGTVPSSSSSSSTHRKQRETSHGSHQHQSHQSQHQSQYQHRHSEKSSKHIHEQLSQSFNPLPDISVEQKKLYHDTIFKYKKPDAPAPVFNPFTNPPVPETPAPISNIFNRLGDKVESGYENFRIQVKNDKAKPKPPKPAAPPAIQVPPALPIRPIDEVLKSPPLSADDIDDLLNESLEAAQGKTVRPSATPVIKESKSIALELVRKKLAMISRVSPTDLESPPLAPPQPPPPPSKDVDEKECFYRRGQTPKKKEKMEPLPKSQPVEVDVTPSLNIAENSPQSPPSFIDPVIKRLALKYHPHRRFEDKPEIQSPPIRDMYKSEPTAPSERLALKYNPHPRRETLVSPLRVADPRISKSMGQLSPLVASPPAVGPVANVLPSINRFDPRLRNSGLTSHIEPIPPAQFCTSLPSYPPTIPRLLDIKVSNPLAGPSNPKPLFGMPATRLDPRTQKPPCTVYADKFNPERNDQTERMKYLESKKKKPPEPKTYKEYRQSKSRQLAAESVTPKPVEPEEQPAVVPTTVSSAPSTLDKMYRSMNYGKDLGKVTQGFKIPKKPKPEEDKPEAKAAEEPMKTEEPANKVKDEQNTTLGEPEKNDETSAKTCEKPAKKDEKSAKKDEKLVKADEKPTKKDEKLVKKDEKSAKTNDKKPSITTEKLEEKTIEAENDVNELSAEANEKTSTVNVGKGNEEPEQSPKILAESLQVQKIKYEAVVASHDESGDILDESQSQDELVIDENKAEDDTHSTAIRRTRGRPKVKKIETDDQAEAVAPPKEADEKAPQEPSAAEEEEEEEIKPRRIRTRRSTLFIDEDDEVKDTSSPVLLTPFRSASEIFGPSTDNSIVSTQNIISGKRRTRAAINFNEKAVKKPVTPKTTPANSPAPTKAAAKPAQKTSAKKAAEPARRMTRSKSVGKRVSDSGQICAVSSTTSQGGDAEESHNEDSIALDEVTQEEPSSSGSKPQTPVVDAEETQKKQEWLEGFLESIVDPSTNKDRILQMLKAVLDEKKLQQVKDILYSPDDNQETGGDTSVASKKQETNKARPKKKNELDRLNEDIRDMFICQGVMTATGRRMCTLAKEGSKDKSATKRESPKEKKTKDPQNTAKESARSTPVEETTAVGVADHRKHIRRAKVTIKPINLRTLRSRTQKQSPAREMPVLEPNTPIKLPEEKEAEESESDETVEMAKNNRKRPVPKSKRSAAALALESDEDELDDDIELIHLKKKIRKENDEEPTKDDSDNLKDEEEAQPGVTAVKKLKTSEESLEKPKPEPKGEGQPHKAEKEVPSAELFLKNVNPEWHTMSDYASCCVICKEKSRYIAPHYLTAHNNAEIYTSRLPPAVLEDIKQGVGNRALYSISKKPNLSAFHYRCPFCDFQATNTLRGWMEHFTIHTGEYQYKCSACFKAMNGCTHLLDHIKKYCPEAKKINREPINLRGHTISGYVCHLCNFIQMLHSGVVKHLADQHNLTDAKSIASIIKVQLIDSTGVPKMEENTEVLEQSVAEHILAPAAPAAAVNEKEHSAPKQSNMEVFLSRELASPTSDVLTERLKSIDQDEGITSESNANTNSQFSDCPAPVPRMTIAERLSQRFKNIEKQNNLLEEVRADETQTPVQPVEEHSAETNEELCGGSIPKELELPAVEETAPIRTDTPQVENEFIGTQSIDSSSVNESMSLVIDEETEERSTADDSGSEDADGIEEDDNDNWEDIEITETKGSNAKDKNKNNSIFQTLSRLYASIAPKKGVKKPKEKKKIASVPLPETTKSCSQEKETTEPSLPIAVPSPQPTCDDAATTSQEATATAQAAQISNLADLLPHSPSDSLDMLLETNFNCLEGDGTSFPHLDLNDLESPIFLMPEDQTNLQDAISMASDLDQTKFDVLGDSLPPIPSQTEVTQPPPLPPKQMAGTSVQRIGNVGFSLSANSVKYYCKVAACTFLFSDHPDGLQNHFLLEHPTLRWNGYCNACQAQVCPDGSREMQHMLEVHSNIKPAEPVEQVVEKPRIKFRRLTGDILSTDKKMPAYPPPPPAPLQEKPLVHEAPPLSLTSLLQSEPRAMIPPTPPVGFAPDLPLYKNVSKEFTITGVAEGVTENDLRNLVINQAETTPGGMQISQVISLNAGGKSLSSRASPAPFSNITFENANSATLNDFRAVLQLPPEIPLSISSPAVAQIEPAPISQPIAPAVNTAPSKQTPFKCCAKKCMFSTYMRSSMHDHIEFHMRTDKDRAAFKCHECGFEGMHTIDYFRHMEQGHNASPRIQPPSTNDLTQKIQDILRSTAAGSNHQVEEVQEKDPLSLETPSEPITERIKEAAEEMTADTGLPDDEVWKCPVARQCQTSITEKDFQAHITKHLSVQNSGTGLKCPHCPVTYQRPAVLRAHIKTHSRHRYFCYVCCSTFFNYQQSQKHFSESHARTSHVQVQTLVPDKDQSARPFLVFNLEKLSATEVLQFGEKLRVDWERKKASTKTHFQPHEQYLLPLQPIFNNQVYCSVCNYKTKVRTNMFRHLQLHIQEVDVASVDPVNPVPCLEKNEKHFDKMLNLACSSNATGGVPKPKDAAGVVKVPAFVPDMKRYVCGHPGCTYLTITDTMLRSHLNALHGGERGYQCPHCQEDICKKTMCAERIVQHLRFHGSKIYQCGECEYLHYTKHVVERHIHEKHSAVPSTNMITFDRTENEVNKSTQVILGKGVAASQSSSNETDSSEGATTSAPQSSKFKWECALCKFQTMTWNQMISHVNSVHRAKHQYHCVHCTFGAAHLAHIMEHIDAKHPSKTREAKYLFYKINETPQDKAADTRPLWTRDDPTRVRSIRGILMENEEDAERTKQSLSKSGVDLDDEDDDVEFIQFIEPEAGIQPGVLGCFHCDFKAEEMSFLASHWRSTHWHVKNAELVPKVPFFFRIHSILKCVSCAFVGDHVTVYQHAINKHGQRAFYAADPKLPYTCGHCPYVYPPKQTDILARHYFCEHRRTDVKNLSTNLLKNILALGECQVYMQCYFCAEICADKTGIIEHERDRHGSSNFRYKQIKDEVIYRCGMCHYSSTNEMATLRHMVDHFEGFGRCHFCKEPQGNFNAYMQHCYASHARELKRFKEIYTLKEMTTFLGQMLLIFPNGLIVDKKNLMHTQYGSTERINAMYEEICKKALEPPIPPLCMARLIAKRSFEASEAKSQGPSPSAAALAKRIAKRRSTVAMGTGDRGFDTAVPAGPAKIRKRKSSISSDDRATDRAEPLFSTITSGNAVRDKSMKSEVKPRVQETKDKMEGGVSFYGKKPEPLDLSKIYTQIAIADKYAPVSVKKFALLFKINAKVVVDKMDFTTYQARKRSRIACKPCPASEKWKHI